MLLVCDSGSTKADWCLVDKENKRKFIATCGMNPYNISQEAICQEIESVLISSINPEDVDLLKFYGAGCSAEVKKNELKEIFSQYFTNANIEIEHDLLGAARALCNNEKGLCAILGTGSNSCLYDGENILENVCPNCGGGFEKRPTRPKELLKKYPTKIETYLKPVNFEEFEELKSINKNIKSNER